MSGYDNIKAYKNAFANVDKLNQVIMLYDGVISSLQQAKQAILDKNIEVRFNKISNAFHIISGLRDSLDHSNGAEVAAVLTEWYSGTAMRILSINRSLDINMCDMCIAQTKQMRDAWLEVEKQVKAQQEVPSAPQATSTSNDNKNESNDGGDFFDTIAKAAYGANGTSSMSISI